MGERPTLSTAMIMKNRNFGKPSLAYITHHPWKYLLSCVKREGN